MTNAQHLPLPIAQRPMRIDPLAHCPLPIDPLPTCELAELPKCQTLPKTIAKSTKKQNPAGNCLPG
jgi:hypothetical protein